MSDESHPLAKAAQRTIESWDQWMKLWNETDFVEFQLGLLHVGFDVPYHHSLSPWEKERAERARILFYLKIATPLSFGDRFHPFGPEGRQLEKLAQKRDHTH